MSTAAGTAHPSASGISFGRSAKVWVGALALIVLWALAAWIYQLTQGLIATGMRDEVSWGLYITTFAFFVGLSAGGLIMASSAEVFGAKSLRPLARIGVLSAAACVLVAAMQIIPDLGRPDRVWELIWYPNWTSPMIWDIIIISVYLIFAVVDLTVMTRRTGEEAKRRRTLRVLAYVGLPAAVLLHSITAWIFGLQFARPFWNTALMAPLFVTSAILSGSALVALVALAARRFDRLALPDETWSTVRKLLATTLAVDLFLVFADYVTILWGNVPRDRAVLNMLLPGGSWQVLFWLEWVVGGLIPFVLLVWSGKLRPWRIGLASALILVGVYAFRIELVVGGLLKPILWFAPGVSIGSSGIGSSSFQLTGAYHPTWVEYSIVLGTVAFLVLLLTVGYKWLRSLDDAEAVA
ncbi:MAG: NrfD/PsrC family molybdoenzyme membrane anchor subunit [Solirubrobacteraceae bacterium]|jgi:molybdopterin-containing oxidoreductase family membrane subunit